MFSGYNKPRDLILGIWWTYSVLIRFLPRAFAEQRRLEPLREKFQEWYVKKDHSLP